MSLSPSTSHRHVSCTLSSSRHVLIDGSEITLRILRVYIPYYHDDKNNFSRKEKSTYRFSSVLIRYSLSMRPSIRFLMLLRGGAKRFRSCSMTSTTILLGASFKLAFMIRTTAASVSCLRIVSYDPRPHTPPCFNSTSLLLNLPSS